MYIPISKLFIASWNMSWSNISFMRDCVGASRVQAAVGPVGVLTVGA